MGETSRTSADRALRVGGEQGLDHVRRRSTQALELLGPERVAHGSETVTAEQLRRTPDLVRREDFEPRDAIALAEPLAQRRDSGVVVRTGPSRTAGSPATRLRCSGVVSISTSPTGVAEPERIVVVRVFGDGVTVGEAVRWHRCVPTKAGPDDLEKGVIGRSPANGGDGHVPRCSRTCSAIVARTRPPGRRRSGSAGRRTASPMTGRTGRSRRCGRASVIRVRGDARSATATSPPSRPGPRARSRCRVPLDQCGGLRWV